MTNQFETVTEIEASPDTLH